MIQFSSFSKRKRDSLFHNLVGHYSLTGRMAIPIIAVITPKITLFCYT